MWHRIFAFDCVCLLFWLCSVDFDLIYQTQKPPPTPHRFHPFPVCSFRFLLCQSGFGHFLLVDADLDCKIVDRTPFRPFYACRSFADRHFALSFQSCTIYSLKLLLPSTHTPTHKIRLAAIPIPISSLPCFSVSPTTPLCVCACVCVENTLPWLDCQNQHFNPISAD